MKFYLGTHRPNWLEKTTIPLFVSQRTLAPRKSLPRALCSWALDSGGFSELRMYGHWRTTPIMYAACARLYQSDIGGMRWAAIQDWMCEPFMLTQTGKSVTEHQQRTIDSYFELRTLAPDVPWIPVLQGWKREDYLSHIEQYYRAGIDLQSLPRVGIGSICRRQKTKAIRNLVWEIADAGIKLHGFGVKITGLQEMASDLASADSMAWSFRARRSTPLPGHSHKNCANCLPYAEQWYRKLQAALLIPRQMRLCA